MYKNYIFDMGNVLLGFDDDRLLSAFIDDEDDKKLIEKELIWSEEWRLGDKGLIDEDELKDFPKDFTRARQTYI